MNDSSKQDRKRSGNVLGLSTLSGFMSIPFEFMSLKPPSPAPTAHPQRPGWSTIAGNSFWLLLEKLFRWVIGLTIGVWVARHLGPHDFGLFQSTLAWVALFAGAAGLGVESIVVRELVRQPERRSLLLTTAIGLRSMGGLVAAAVAIIVAVFWPSAAPPVALTAVAALVTLFSVNEALDLWFQANLQARAAAAARTTAFTVTTVVRVILILSDSPVVAFLGLAAGEALLTSGIMTGVLIRRGGRVGRTFSTEIARDLLRESWPNIISNLANLTYLRADRIMLAAMTGEASAGIYSAAAGLVEIWYILPMALINSATPVLTQKYEDDATGFQRDFWRLTRGLALVSWLLVVLLAGTSSWLVPLLFGLPYAQAAPVLTWLAFAMPFAFMGIAAIPWYLNKKLTVSAMHRHLIGGALNLALNFVFIPRWGAPGAAAATVASFAVAHVFCNAIDPRTRPIFRFQCRALCLHRKSPPV